MAMLADQPFSTSKNHFLNSDVCPKVPSLVLSWEDGGEQGSSVPETLLRLAIGDCSCDNKQLALVIVIAIVIWWISLPSKLPLLLSPSLIIEADQDISGSLNASDSDLTENAIRSGHEVIFQISLKMVFSPFHSTRTLVR